MISSALLPLLCLILCISSWPQAAAQLDCEGAAVRWACTAELLGAACLSTPQGRSAQAAPPTRLPTRATAG